MTTNTNKPDIIQAFDFYVDREYYKIIPGFFGSSNRLIRTDRLKDWVEWDIQCAVLPDKININGHPFKVVKEVSA